MGTILRNRPPVEQLLLKSSTGKTFFFKKYFYRRRSMWENKKAEIVYGGNDLHLSFYGRTIYRPFGF